MKVVIVYKDNSDHARVVLDYLRDFERQTGRKISTIDPDSLEGIDICRAYDIVEYPSCIAMSDQGASLNIWRGLPLPTINEVSYYV